MSLSGNLRTMDLAELLQWIMLGRRTGFLTFVHDKIKNHIIFKEGRIISSKSNEPTRQLGHYMLFSGKISEVQLKKALEIQQQTRSSLGKILVQQGMITKEEAEKALVSRTEEVIYDLFLWEEGYFHFTANGFDYDEIIPVSVDINAIIFEGVRRKDEWARIRAAFPNNNTVLTIRKGADLKSLELKPLQKKLLFMVSQGKTISEMILELHGSDFQVNFALFELHDQNVLEVKEVRSMAPAREDPGRLFRQGMDLMKSKRYQDAINVFQAVLRLDPSIAKADELIDAAEKFMCRDFYQSTTPADKTPYFIVPDYALTRVSLSHQEGFVASRITGACDIKSIVMLSPLRELEILQIIDKLLKLQLIALR